MIYSKDKTETLLTVALTRHQIPPRWHSHWHRIERKFGTEKAVQMLEYDQAEIVRMKRVKAVRERAEAEREEEREQVAA